MSSNLAAVDAAAEQRAAYVHIPFCRRRCPYCDFAVVDMSTAASDIAGYVAAVQAEMAMEPLWQPLHAVNLGGGTPSALDPSQVASLLETLLGRFGIVRGAEVSIEANPEDWTPNYAAALRNAGVTRVSLGIQSFSPAVLRYLGRGHTPEQGRAAIAAGREAGMGSINLDLIFGSPGESFDSWRETVASALATGPDHISIYALTVERGTALSRAIQAGCGRARRRRPGRQVRVLRSGGGRRGFRALRGVQLGTAGSRVSLQRMTTWAHGEYIAFGVGAHGYRSGVRTRNVRRIDRYLEAVSAGTRPLAGTERLGGWERERERLFVGLRRVSGVAAGELGREFLCSPGGRRLVAAGVIRHDDGRLVVANPLLTDAVARELLAFTPAR
jgi:putative oxygen-independent coproporphyrinogen III oxidase